MPANAFVSEIRLPRWNTLKPNPLDGASTELLNLPRLSVVEGSGLGGTSLINANVAIIPDREIFERTEWPRSLKYESLLPYYLRVGGYPASTRADTPAEVSALLRTHWALGGAGVVVGNPTPEAEALSPDELHEGQHRVRAHGLQFRFRVACQRFRPVEVASFRGNQRLRELRRNSPPEQAGLSAEPGGFGCGRDGQGFVRGHGG